MLIPKTFKLFGKTIKVGFVKKIDSQDSRGEWSYLKSKIKIKKDLEKDEQEVVFLHEVIHAILENLEYMDLNADEDFVERFSRALHQILITGEE